MKVRVAFLSIGLGLGLARPGWAVTQAEPPAAPEPPPAPEQVPAAEPAPAPDPGAAVVGSPGLFEHSQRAPDAAAAEPGAAAPSAGAPALVWHGYTRGDVFLGRTVGTNTPELKAAYAELALRLELDEPGLGSARAEARLRSGLDGVAPQSSASSSQVELREAYVNAYLGPVDLRVGHQIIVWGRADAFNPTNNLTPIDIRTRSPVEDDRRRGNFATRLWLDLSPVRLEGVWLPLYEASELPSIQLPEFVRAVEPSYPGPQLENGLVALRVHLELPAVDASVSVLRGYAPLPGLALSGYTAGVDPPEIRITRAAYRQTVLGLDFSTGLGEIAVLRGEAAYRRPVDHEQTVHAPRPDLQYVLGVERDFGALGLIVQYMGRYVFDWLEETGPEDPLDPLVLVDFTAETLPPFLRESIDSSIEADLRLRNQILFAQRERVQHLVSVRAEWRALNDALSLSALGLVNFTTREWLLYPKLAYQISDWMSAAAGAELYAGPDGSSFDLIEDALSAGYAELRLSF